jgi:ubiquinone/menaquinone biosynthesis C-methylase UbiE
MIPAGDRKFYSMLQRQSNAHYSSDYASLYRESDDLGKKDESHRLKADIISQLSSSFEYPINVLDLGCGTGRYFHCMQNAKNLVGVDASWHMLQAAKTPVYGGTQNVQLIQSGLHVIEFKPAVFDLVISVGVFGMLCPLDQFALDKMARISRPGAILFLTMPEYKPVTYTWKGKTAKFLEPLLLGPAKRYVNAKLLEFQMDENTLASLVSRYFTIINISRWVSPTTRVDLHCVAKR